MILARIRRLAAATTFAALVLTVGGVGAGSAALAAPNPAVSHIAMHAWIGQNCVMIEHAAPKANVTIVQRRKGAILARGTDKADSGGDARVCLKPLKSGDQLSLTSGATARSITVPAMSIVLHAATDLVTGRIGTSRSTIQLFLFDNIAGQQFDSRIAFVTTSSTGRFSYDSGHAPGSDKLDLRGTDHAIVSWKSSKGDTVGTDSPMLPGFLVEVGQAKATIYDRVGATVTLTLRTSAGDPKGTLTRKLTSATATGSFTDNGLPVTVAEGDRVSTSSVIGKELVVLTDTLDLTSADGGTITATCFANGEFTATVFNGTTKVYPWGGYGHPDGSVAISGAVPGLGDGVPAPAGDTVELMCDSLQGFTQRMVETFP